MRGTDVVKALSLGADVVGIGRLQGLAAAAGGSKAIYRMLELLELEIITCLRLLGVNDITDLNSNLLTKDDSFGTLDALSAFPLINEGYWFIWNRIWLNFFKNFSAIVFGDSGTIFWFLYFKSGFFKICIASFSV